MVFELSNSRLLTVVTFAYLFKFSVSHSATRLSFATQQTFYLQVSQSGYTNLISGHPSLQSPTEKWRNNELLKTCRLVFYEQGGRYPDWLTCIKSLLGGHGKARRTVIGF